ncbi:hypothetical protein HA466_0144380 [Hirschfeldia incana]|nr:hypothetical protein HA466_0144380 [Hirschfeldia incana]
MECLGTILAAVVAETCRGMCSRAHATMFRSNTKTLKKELERLKKVQSKVNEDLNKLGNQDKSLKKKLMIWLRKVEENVSTGEMILENRSSCAIFSSDKSVAVLEEIKRLNEQGHELLVETSIVESSRERVELVLGPSFHPQKTAQGILDTIKDCLKKENVQKIGIWGMGGVGKTTLVRTLNNEFFQEAATQQFALVVWVTVSKDFDLRKIQMDIATRMRITFTKEEKKDIGKIIHDRLSQLKSFLLILDDVWKPIDLDSLGIPSAAEGFKDFKVVLTSRRLEVCQQMMTDENIRVGYLQETEAWELFCHNAGEIANSDEVKPLAMDVSRECGGLPLAIITIGRALRGKRQVEVWKHALNMLKSSAPSIDTEEKIFGTLKLSYDFLQDKTKGCFLFCALFPEDFSIKVTELIMYWVVEGFLDDQQHYEDLINEGVTLVDGLKDSCLLEEGDRADTVKMHDVVRDFAIWIMSLPKEGFHSLVMAGRGLKEIPKYKFVPSLQRISFMANNLNTLPDHVVECVETSVLILQKNSYLKEVPHGFLQAFPNLRILDLSGVRIRTLPDSVLNHYNLRSLVLRNCKYLRYLPSLKSLVKLQILDLHESGIKEFPRGLEALISLRYIFLSNTRQLRSIPARTILGLSSLEVLDMSGSDYRWGLKGTEREGQATLEEVTCLSHLQFLAIKFHNVLSFSNEFNSLLERLRTFKLLFSPIIMASCHATGKGCLSISDVDVSEASIGWLLVHVTSLSLIQCAGLNAMFKNLVTMSNISFVAVKSLSLHQCSNLSFSGGYKAKLDLFPNLDEISLVTVNLKSIGELTDFLGLRFKKLRMLHVSSCEELKNIFSYKTLAGSLPNLEEIKVKSCRILEELFNFSSAPVGVSPESLLPKLSVVRLDYLPQLRRVCSDGTVLKHLKQLEVKSCELLPSDGAVREDLKPLEVQSCELLQNNGKIVKDLEEELDWYMMDVHPSLWRHARAPPPPSI